MMQEDRDARARQLVEAYRERLAADMAEPAEEFLSRHEDLRDLLEPLLQETLAWTPEPTATADDMPEYIGPYRVLEMLGEGGMGTVYSAEQRKPVRRRVAIKVIKLGMDSKEVLLRFDAERQALAMMEHDNIAKVFDAGVTERGQPYFAMEYVRGLSLNDYCERQMLSTRERILLLQQVCSGVQHAHQKGIIHRDLKPSNILVTEHQGRAIPKIIDFGVAKATNQRLTEATLFTGRGDMIGTPGYMAPEQAEMTVADIDTRADVYSLGVILYELLVGEPPFSSAELRRAGFLGIQRKIREDEPPKPSTKLSSLGVGSRATAKRRRTTVASLMRELRGDLDWIVMRAMEKERNRRYPTPISLAEDLERYIDHEPVNAGPPNPGYRLAKFVRRNRVQVVAGLLILLTLLAGTIVSTSFAIEAQAALSNFDLLSNIEKLRSAKAQSNDLYPAWPEVRDRMQAWIDGQATPLAEELPRLEGALRSLREHASTEPGDGEPQFTDGGIEFLYESLASLVPELRNFVGEGGELASVRARMEWADVEAARTANHQEDWQTARAAINAEYGFDLKPQTGLVPIGKNPDSGLWEFYHMASSAEGLPVPSYDDGESIRMTDGTGLLFVLIPGGTFTMGTQSLNPSGTNYDVHAEDDESPLQEVTLEPFFLSKFEMTQGQWRRVTGGETPSQLRAGDARTEGLLMSDANPVESVSWTQCAEILRQQGMSIPTESQWEYACRAGTTTIWSTGDDRESLHNYANLVDQSTAGVVNDWPLAELWDDGAIIHVPVGSYRPNAFGMYDMHGNVREWCRDWFQDNYADPEPGDGYRRTTATDRGHVNRGGSFHDRAEIARSGDRVSDSTYGFVLGIRPARPILQ